METCQVCFEEFNKSTRKRVECPKCQFHFCVTCIKRYIVEEGCFCLNCKKDWDFDFLSSNLSAKFMKTEYALAQGQKLVDREMALLPDTMYYVEMYKKGKECEEKRRQLYDQMEAIKQEMYNVENATRYYNGIVYGTKTPNTLVKSENVGHCPKEDCRGFIKRASWSCGICETKICKDCRDILSETEHQCNPELIATAKLIDKECRPCPKCSAAIFKINGCDQMFCTACNTAFSWQTGKVVSGRIHNPHYYEWVRNTRGFVPREEADVPPCENNHFADAVDLQILTFAHINEADRNQEYVKKLFTIHRRVNHYQSVLDDIDTQPPNNRRLRMSYLMQEIDKGELMVEVEKRERLYMKHVNIHQVMQVYVSVMKEHFRHLVEQFRFVRGQKKLFVEALNNLFTRHEEIQSFTNENITKIERKFHCSLKRYRIVLDV